MFLNIVEVAVVEKNIVVFSARVAAKNTDAQAVVDFENIQDFTGVIDTSAKDMGIAVARSHK